MGVPIDRGLTQFRMNTCVPLQTSKVEMGVPIDRGLTHSMFRMRTGISKA